MCKFSVFIAQFCRHLPGFLIFISHRIGEQTLKFHGSWRKLLPSKDNIVPKTILWCMLCKDLISSAQSDHSYCCCCCICSAFWCHCYFATARSCSINIPRYCCSISNHPVTSSVVPFCSYKSPSECCRSSSQSVKCNRRDFISGKVAVGVLQAKAGDEGRAACIVHQGTWEEGESLRLAGAVLCC